MIAAVVALIAVICTMGFLIVLWDLLEWVNENKTRCPTCGNPRYTSVEGRACASPGCERYGA